MDSIRELFVSYARTDDEAPSLRLVEDREVLETIKNGAPLFKRVGSIINVETTDASHPIINIVCVTDKSLRAGEPDHITNEVVNWLREIGEMWT